MKLLQQIGIFLGSGIFFLASWSVISPNVGIDLTKANKATGQVIFASVVKRISTGKYATPQNVFAFQLDNLDKPLGTFRPGQNYSKLIETIKIGDTITVYYRHRNSERLNIDVYQIEKNGQILQDYTSYNRNNLILGIFIGLVGLGFLIYGVWTMHKRKYSR